MRWPVVAVLLAQSLRASEPLPKELAYAFDLSRQLPAPLAAAQILKLIDRHGLKDELARNYSAEAYRYALEATARPILVYAGLQREANMVFAPRQFRDFNPETLAVRAWAIHYANSPDKKKVDIDRPLRKPTPPLACETFYTLDPGDYYEKVLELDPRLAQYSTYTTSAIDLARLLEAMLKTNKPDHNAIIRLLSSITDGDRGFFYATRRLRLHDSLLTLAKQSESFASSRLLSAYRDFLLRHWHQKRCPDLASESYLGIVTEFNEALTSRNAYLRLKPEDAKPLSLVTMEAEPAFFDALAQNINQRIATAEMNDTLTQELLAQIESWRPNDKTPLPQALAIRAALYASLLNRLGKSWTTDRVARSWIQFVSSSNSRREAVPVWYFSYQSLMADWVNGDRNKTTELETCSDPSIAALATLSRP